MTMSKITLYTLILASHQVKIVISTSYINLTNCSKIRGYYTGNGRECLHRAIPVLGLGGKSL